MPEDFKPELPTQDNSTLIGGMFLAWGLNIAHAAFGFLILAAGMQDVGVVVLGALALLQVLYIAPMAVIAKRVGKIDRAKGLTIGASITFLLSAACYGAFWGAFR